LEFIAPAPAEQVSVTFGRGNEGAMGVSIYYTASRPKQLSLAERSAVEALIARYPLAPGEKILDAALDKLIKAAEER
jgi:hypothetical protein